MKILTKKTQLFLIALVFFSFSLPVWALEPAAVTPAAAFGDESDADFLRRRGLGRDARRLSLPVGGAIPAYPTTPLPPAFIRAEESSPYLNETLAIPNDPYYSTKGSLYSGFPQLEDLWGVKLLNSEAAWDFTRGAGVVVAVVDTGVYLNHAELQGNIWFNQREKDGVTGIDDDGNGFIDDVNGWDFVGNDKDPSDLNGHGTHVAGIIGALKDNGKGIVGIAPEADIMAVRVLNSFGEGTFLDVSKGIRYAASMGARVINLSLGATASSLPQSDMDLLTSAVQYAYSLGAVVVAAAGNSGGDIANEVPAMFDEVISVGALRHQYDTFYGSGALGKARFSSFGDELDFMAGGIDILSLAVSSATYAGYRTFFKDGSYYSASDGTSMAAPMVSGAIALLLAQNPLQTFDDIYRRLRYSSTDLGTAGFDNNNGWGLVNAFKALSEDYYDGGIIRTRFFAQPDLYGIVRREFDLSGNIVDQYDLMGNRAVFEYWTGTSNVHRVSLYDISNILQRTNEYDENGVTLLRSLYPDGRVLEYHPGGWVIREIFPSGVVHEYYSSGKLSRLINADGSYTTYQRYYLDTDIAFFQMDYDPSGNLLSTRMYQNTGAPFEPNSTFTYYANGALESYTDHVTGIITEYFDENFYGNLIGRVSKISYPSGLAHAFTYVTATETVQTRRTLVNGSLRFIDTMCVTCAPVNIQMREFASGDKHTFFGSGNWKESLNASTGRRYQYLDENFFGDKTGRFTKKFNGDGSYDEYKEYWPNSDQVKVLKRFSSGGALAAVFEYDEDGTLVRATGSGVTDITGTAINAGQPAIAANGHVVWSAHDGNDVEVYLYNGASVQNISNNNFDDQGAKINGGGQVTWSGYDGNDYEIFFYNGSSVTQITNNSSDDRNPELNDAGKITWENLSGTTHAIQLYNGASTTTLRSTTQDIDSYSINSSGKIVWRQIVSSFEQDIYLHNGASVITVRDFGKNFNIKLANNGHVVWQREFASTDHDIVLYNGSFASSIASNLYFEKNPDINSSGHVVYQKQESSAADYEIYLYKNGTTSRLTTNSYNDEFPLISDNGVIAWRGNNELFVYQNGSTTQLTNNVYTEEYRMSRNGRLTWRVSDGNDTEIFSYDGVSISRLTDNNVDDGLPSINSDGEIAWSDANGRMNYFSLDAPFTGDAPDFCEEASSCGYYANGRLRSKLLANGTYREFLNENFFGDNTGRVLKEIQPGGSYTAYESYFSDFNIARFQKDFNAAGKLLETREYGLGRNLISLSTHYSDGRIRSVTFSFPNGDGIITYEYLDENWQGQGYGRISRKLFADGKESRFIEYYPGTDKVKLAEFYQSGTLIKTVEYAADGVTVTKITLANGDIFKYYASGNLKNSLIQGTLTEYLDENFYGNDTDGHGKGRLSRTLLANGQEVRYLEYHPNTDKPKKVAIYHSGTLTRILEYLPDGLEREITYYYYRKDSSGNFLETILDNSKGHWIYDNAGNLKNIFDKQTLNRFEYKNGVLSRIMRADKSQFLYTQSLSAGGSVISKLYAYISPSRVKTIYPAPTSSSFTPRGYLDQANATISGWAANPSNPSEALDVEILVNGEVKYLVPANLFRGDLNPISTGIPGMDANHGFSLQTKDLKLFSGTYAIQARAVSNSTGYVGPLENIKTLASSFQPLGYLDQADLSVISGWAKNPSNSNDFLEVEILVNGQVKGRAIANLAHADSVNVGNHGYNFAFKDLNLDPGNYTIQTRAVNSVTGFSGNLVGTKTVTVAFSPQGYLDQVNGGIVSGWAVNPDNPGELFEVEILVNGQVKARALANQSRPDLVSAGITPDPYHGYSVSVKDLDLPTGFYTFEARAIHPSGNFKTLLTGAKTLNVSFTSQGHLDQVSSTISGWAKNSSDPSEVLDVEALVDGEVKYRTTANQAHPDAVNVGNHGFSLDTKNLKLPSGIHTIQTRAVSNSTGYVSLLQDTKILTAFFTPQGYLDTANLNTISGWAKNPSNSNDFLEVEILVNGQVKGRAIANLAHADSVNVGNHGYNFAFKDLNLDPGNYTIQTRAVNSVTGFSGNLVGTKTVTVTVPPSALQELTNVQERLEGSALTGEEPLKAKASSQVLSKEMASYFDMHNQKTQERNLPHRSSGDPAGVFSQHTELPTTRDS